MLGILTASLEFGSVVRRWEIVFLSCTAERIQEGEEKLNSC
jgi:hypothetical protein